jgi:ATPase family associated with various cellular activities (AAA)
MLDRQGISTRFKAGISVVALSSPTAAENAVVQELVQEFGGDRSIQTWDCSNQLQTVRARMNGRTVTGIERQPDTSFQVNGHPIDSLLKHITNLCQNPNQAGAKTLFIVKDLYAFVTGVAANAALVRSLKECCFALKRSSNRMVILHDGLRTPLEFQDLIADMHHSLPSESETAAIAQQRITMLQRAATSAGHSVEQQLDDDGMKRLVRSLLGMTQEGMEDTLQLVITRDGHITEGTIGAISQIKQQRFASQGIEYAPAPDVTVQGMPNLTTWAKTLAKLLEPAAQEEWNIPFPKGVLLAGEGGTGKTLAVKCLAQELGLPVIVLDTSKLMQKELGASEENLRNIIAAAEAMAPSILFIDEMEKMFGGSDLDGGTSSRMFGYLLQWFQEHESPVFVAATVNEPWRLKPELLRRFAKAFLVDLPDIEARRNIFAVQADRFKLSISTTDLQTLAEQTPDFTGDEIRKVVHECAAAAYACGHPGQVDLVGLMVEVDRKEPQFRNNRDRLDKLRAWMSAGNASPVRSAPVHPDMVGDRSVAVEFL